MMFELSEENRMLKELVAKFVDQELIPLERQVLAREAAPEGLAPSLGCGIKWAEGVGPE